MIARRWTYVAATVVVLATVIAASALKCRSGATHDLEMPSGAGLRGSQRAVAVVPRLGSVAPVGSFRLEGQVIDEDERPVADATVTLRPGEVRTKTEADGSFAFDALPGRYCLYADAGDLYSKRASVQLDATTEPVTLRMVRGTTVVVRVTGDDSPLAGAEVNLDYTDPIVTGADGIARFRGRWPGSFELTAVASGYAMETTRVEIATDPGVVLEHPMTLRRGAPLSGTVVDDMGKLVGGATLDIEGLADRRRAHATSDASGAWRVDAVAAGRYHVSAKSKNYGPTVAAPFDLDGVTPRSGVVVRVAAGGVVFGAVVDAKGAPVEGVGIVLQQSARVDQFTDKSDANGRYEIRGLPAGSYLVLRLIGDYLPIIRTIAIADGQRLEVPIVVDDDHVDGVVVDPNGTPVVGAWVSGDDGQSQDVTDARGHFELVLPKGKSHNLAARWHHGDDHGREPDAQVEGSAHGVRLVLAPTATISGRVLLDGKPVSSYALLVAPVNDRNGSDGGILVRAADGRFAKRDVRAGKWRVSVIASGCDLATGAEVVAEPGKTIDIGDLVLKRGTRITGHVFDVGGRAVAGAQVTMGWSSDDVGSVRAQFEGSAKTVTDTSGAYVFDGLSRTSLYRRRSPIRATHPLFGVSAEREVLEGESTIDLVLVPMGGIDGVVEGFRGDQKYLSARRDGDEPGGGQAGINRAGEFHFENLPPGTYTIREDTESDSLRVRPFKATVVASQRTKVRATLETNTVTVLARVTAACNQVVTITGADDSSDQVGSVACSGEVTTLPYVVPGNYRACDWARRCASISVVATPPTQTIEIVLAK